KYESGSRMSVKCPADGTEMIINVSDFNLSAEDDVPGKFTFEFEQAGLLATANVIFYVNEGYDVPKLEADEPVDFQSQAYENMIRKSLLHQGNNKRLKRAIEKAKRGEDVTIAYIGGANEPRAGAKPVNPACYSSQTCRDLQRQIGETGV